MKKQTITRILIALALLCIIFVIIFIILKSSGTHSLVGKFGCVPNYSLLLNRGKFESIEKMQGSRPYYYINFSTVFLHLDDGEILEYSPAYFRSEDPNIADFWNEKRVRIVPCFPYAFGIGVCNMTGDTLPKDNEGWRYFTDYAFFCGKNQEYPETNNCEVSRAYRQLHMDYMKEHSH